MAKETVYAVQDPQRIGDAQKRRGWRYLAHITLLCVVGAAAVGCPRPVAYQPQTGLVASLGEQEAEQRLKDVLFRAVNPRIDVAEINDDFLRYHVQGTTVEIVVYFKDVQRPEVFDNHWVYLWKDERHTLARILFANQEDAKRFADLFMSFRDYYTRDRSAWRPKQHLAVRAVFAD
jgi:hypothetical protein